MQDRRPASGTPTLANALIAHLKSLEVDRQQIHNTRPQPTTSMLLSDGAIQISTREIYLPVIFHQSTISQAPVPQWTNVIGLIFSDRRSPTRFKRISIESWTQIVQDFIIRGEESEFGLPDKRATWPSWLAVAHQ